MDRYTDRQLQKAYDIVSELNSSQGVNGSTGRELIQRTRKGLWRGPDKFYELQFLRAESCQIQVQVAGSWKCQSEVGFVSGAGVTALELGTGAEVLCSGNFPDQVYGK
jgi:hypothetical protein